MCVPDSRQLPRAAHGSRPVNGSPTYAEWQANGLAALDHLGELYYAGEPGGMTVGDYRAATDAIRTALKELRPAICSVRELT